MNEVKVQKRKRSEHGGTTVEAVTAIIILFFIVFAMLQVYHWCMSTQICQYSAFYTTKSLALGYQAVFAERAARVAAIAISGKSTGTGDDNELAAENYMIDGDGSGVRYEYWHPKGGHNAPSLGVQGRLIRRAANDACIATGVVTLENAPLLESTLATFLSIKKSPEPTAKLDAYSYGSELLEYEL